MPQSGPHDANATLNPQQFLDMVFSFAPLLAVRAALQLDLFTRISAQTSTLEKLAESLDADRRGLKMLLDALVSMGLLAKGGGKFELTSQSETYLLRDREAYMGGFFEVSPALLGDWMRLEQAVKTGGPVRPVEAAATAEDFFPPLVSAMYAANLPGARVLANRLEIGTRHRGLSILDVGAGSGVWGIGAALEDPSATVTAIDFPRILTVAQEHAAKTGVAERFRFVPGDAARASYEDDVFDIALLGNICHILGEQGSREAFKNIFPALKSGGRIVIIDIFPDEERSGPPFPQLFALTMLLHTRQGGTFTVSEYTRWLSEAGFKDVEHIVFGPTSSAIVASK